jgi:hypothetical protein
MYVLRTLGDQLHSDVALEPNAGEFIRRAALAYEAAAVAGLDELRISGRADSSPLADQAAAAAYRAFELRRALTIPTGSMSEYAFHVLQLGALAYCSDRWAEFRSWLRDMRVVPGAPPAPVSDDWDDKLLTRLTEIWLRLLRKEGWTDLGLVARIVAELRTEQLDAESEFFAVHSDGERRPLAWRLISLYHWARASELLAEYMLQGTPSTITTDLDQHFDRAIESASNAVDAPFEVLLRWLHVLSRRMVAGSIWNLSTVGVEARSFVESVTKQRALFELLPPQRVAVLEQGLLDQASAAVVVDLPTSAGKTILAEFKILQALNQFREVEGWVAYVAPTRALVAQVARRLREDLGSIGIVVEQLTAAVEIDDVEQTMLAASGQSAFQVLVSTPEKLQLLIRNQSVTRPLALLVLDEAQNIEDEERGIRIELLLATAKRDCPDANFLLLMPNVPNASDLARWLAPDSGRSISLSTAAWQPNDRLVGLVEVDPPPTGRGRDWGLRFETLVTSPRTLHLEGSFRLGSTHPIDRTYSTVRSNLTAISAAAARSLSSRGSSIVVARTINDAWTVGRLVANALPPEEPHDDIQLVQRYLATEISHDFELISLLDKRIGVHHAGLSDEARTLLEWLTERGLLRVLAATSTITQGLNFPVSSVFLATRQVPVGTFSKEMSLRAFWNLAGRAGRIDQDSIGVVGLASRNGDREGLQRYVRDATGDLVSRLTTLLNDLSDRGNLLNLQQVIYSDQWSDFRSYVAHLYKQKESLDAVLGETEALLRNTFGYTSLASGSELDREKGRALLEATKSYAVNLAEHPETATLADSTGFSPEGVRNALAGLRHLDTALDSRDWQPASLFGDLAGSALPDLMGVLLRVPQIRGSIEELTIGEGLDSDRIAEIAQQWVQGASIRSIAEQFFMAHRRRDITSALSQACKAIYRNLSMAGSWGLSALAKLPASGIEFDRLAEDQRRAINLLGAMVYHGVASEAAVLMRMNAVPRTVAEPLGQAFSGQRSSPERAIPAEAREFVAGLSPDDWESVRPAEAVMTGEDYRLVWRTLSGS